MRNRGGGGAGDPPPIDLQARPRRLSRASLDRLLLAFGAIHALLIVLVNWNGAQALVGDRAVGRLTRLQAVAESGPDFWATVFYYGWPGEWLFFLPAYQVAGLSGVLVQNILLFLVGLYFLIRLGERFFTRAVTLTAVIAYCALPGTLFHPQQLVTEAVCDPVLIIAIYFASRLLTDRAPRLRDAVLLGLCMAVLALVRQVYVLFPLIIAGLMMWRHTLRPQAVMSAGVVVALGLSLTMGWRALDGWADGRFEKEQGYSHGLAMHLHLRAQRMARISGAPLPAVYRERTTLSPGEFLGLAAERPGAAVKTYLSDAVNLFANPGVAMVYGRFLGVFDLNDDGDAVARWRDIRDKQGMGAMLLEIWRVSPLALIMNALFFGLWVIFLALSACGLILLARMSALPLPVRLLWLAVPAYFLTMTFAAGSTRWDHRSPAEFIFAFGFAIAVISLRLRLRGPVITSATRTLLPALPVPGSTDRRPRVAIAPIGNASNTHSRLFAEAIAGEGAQVFEHRPATHFLEAPDAVILHWPDQFFVRRSGLRAVLQELRLFNLGLTRRLRGSKVVWVAHNIRPHDSAALSPSLVGRFLRTLDGVIFLSGESREAARAAYPEMMARVRSTVVAHGHYRDTFSIPPQSYTPPQGAVRLLLFGQIRPYKNALPLACLVREMETAPRAGEPEMHLHIAGRWADARLREDLQAVAQGSARITLDLRDGFLPQADFERAVDAAHGIVMPYREITNSGTSFFALSRNRPVLTRRQGGLEEIREAVGADWICYMPDGDLTRETLAGFAAHLGALEGGARADLSVMDWSRIGADLGHFLRSL